jgi:eukaryotic-like serine/threonine-protein kinase
MRVLKHLILEAHRRSLWQVLGVYLFASWVTLQVVSELTRTAGLPEWVPPFALVLLLVGLPIVLATAFVQEGAPGQGGSGAPAATAPEPVPFAAAGPGAPPPAPGGPLEAPPSDSRTFLQRHLTWKRALVTGVGAFGLLGLLTAIYLVSWATGIGPVGSLVAQGALEEGDRLLIADFSTTMVDAGLGSVVTDALRIDLLEAPVLRVVEPSDIQEVLGRMQRAADGPLTPELAREVALRDGIKAILEGEIAQAGAGYVLTATLRGAETGRSLAGFRETARNADEVIPAIDRLSRRIRERAGESLRSIHAGERLESVTTSSLAALQRYSDAIRAFERADDRRTIALLEEALELDPEFAMAWRQLAVVLGNTNADHERALHAATRAYELRSRLGERERQLAVARYHSEVTGDRHAMQEAYRRVLELEPDNRQALNNLAISYQGLGDLRSASELLERAIRGPGVSSTAFGNLIAVRLAQGRFHDALAVADDFSARYPQNFTLPLFRAWVYLALGELDVARTELEPLLTDAGAPAAARVHAHDRMARLAMWEGRAREAREHFEAAERMAEAGGSLHLNRVLISALFDITVGDPGRGVARLRDAERMAGALPAPNRWYFVQATAWGMASRPDEAEAVIRRFHEEVDPAIRLQVQWFVDLAAAIVPLHRGDTEEALKKLEDLRAERSCAHCFAARTGWALRESGRLREAAAEWEDALTWSDLSHPPEWHTFMQLWTLQRLPALYEELGETDRAIEHYRRLAEMWADADPELQPRVRHARERIAALTGGR